jgi:Transcriptional repressor TCF25
MRHASSFIHSSIVCVHRFSKAGSTKGKAMSTRAIRALRGESSSNADVALSSVAADFDSDDDGSEDLVERHRTAPISFSIFNDDSDDDSLHEENELLENDGHNDEEESSKGNPSEKPSKKNEIRSDAMQSNNKICETEVDEDIDELLSEFQERDYAQLISGSLDPSSVSNEPFAFDFILKSFDTRDLDVDFTMRTSMLHAARVDERTNQPRKLPSSSLFGPPMDGWIRPPRYVGGGIGMTTYDSMNDRSSVALPWPYSDSTYQTSLSSADEASASMAPESPLKRWCTFLFSDLVTRDVQDYFTLQRTGDINAVILFVAHHPYVTEALLQLSNVLYQTNHSSEGLSLLRRCLWIYESSSLPSIVSQILQGRVFLMDSDRQENLVFFQTLFRLVQVSSVSGYVFRSHVTISVRR